MVEHDFIRALKEKVKSACYVEYECEHSMCTPECRESNDYCRCRQITRVCIESVELAHLISELIGSIKNPIQAYCIERILNHSNLADKHSWEIETGAGYYGEEVYGASCDIESLVKSLNKFLKLKTHKKMIEFVLEHEYGYILPRLENRKWKLESIGRAQVAIPNEEYSHRTNQKTIEYYQSNEWQEMKLPVAVCSKENGVVRLVDGYHRFTTLKDKKIIDVIVAE